MVSYSATLGGVVAPALIGLFLFCPVLDRSNQPGGRWFAKERLSINVVFALIFLSQIALIVAGQWFRSKNWDFTIPW